MKALRELLAAAALLFTILTVATNYSTLPQRIPTHFNAAGIVNHWGDKSALWMIAGIACFFYAIFTVAVRFAPASTFNVPVPPDQRAAAIPIARELMAWVKTEVMFLFALLTWAILAVAEGRAYRLSLWFLPATLIVIVGTIAYYVWSMMSLREA
jgi:uncharacterized membrane protein